MSITCFFLFLMMGNLSAQNCPMKDGIMEVHHFSLMTYYNQTEESFIFSDEKEVYSVSDGIVLSIITNGNIKAVLVKQCIIGEDDQYYAYSNLESTELKKGDWIENGQVVGEAKFNEEKFEFHFQHRIKLDKRDPKDILSCKIANIYH